MTLKQRVAWGDFKEMFLSLVLSVLYCIYFQFFFVSSLIFVCSFSFHSISIIVFVVNAAKENSGDDAIQESLQRLSIKNGGNLLEKAIVGRIKKLTSR